MCIQADIKMKIEFRKKNQAFRAPNNCLYCLYFKLALVMAYDLPVTTAEVEAWI